MKAEALPETLPVLLLRGVVLLPGGRLPLNMFEPAHVALVDDALRSPFRMIGIVQPRLREESADSEGLVCETGCAGRITQMEEDDEKSYRIVLSGLCRFRIPDGRAGLADSRYWQASPEWTGFLGDLDPPGCMDLDRVRLKDLLASYFDMHEIACSPDMIDQAPDEKLITCLSMICPFDAREKQALLEARDCRARAELFMTMLEMAVCHRLASLCPEAGNIRH